MTTIQTLLLSFVMQNSLGIDSSAVDINETLCLAQNIYNESRGEPIYGRFAVAHTTLNRVHDKRYPNTVCAVVKQRTRVSSTRYVCQFSWYCDNNAANVVLYYNNGKPNVINSRAFTQSAKIALMVISGQTLDNTGGATHFYNSSLAKPNWARHYAHTVTYGQHEFHRRETGSLL